MKVLSLVQGSDQWLAARRECFCASDCAAMMGASKYKSRNQLLHEKKTGTTEPVSPTKQAIFDRGHETEASARVILEVESLEEYAPKVCALDINGISLLASLDGMSEGGETLFEHKLWNETLAANVSNEVLEPHYYWQLEQQLLVTGATSVIFVVSDGTESNWIEMVYGSVPDRRKQLLAGWKQFAKDLETYEVEAKQEAVVANESEAFPLVSYQVEGSAISSNLANILKIVKARAEVEMNRTLETDQDFADKENFNKSVKAARAQLKERTDSALGEFVSLSEYKTVAEQLDSVLQKMLADGEKQVKDEKAKRKGFIVSDAEWQMSEYCTACNEKIKPLALANICSLGAYDFGGVMKGLRSVDKMKSAVDTLVANCKIDIDQVMARVVPNQIYLKEHATKLHFLFADVAQIINQETEPFQAIVKSRIADHEKAKEEEDAALRESIRKEEEQKAADKLKREQEAADKLKSEQEEQHVEPVSAEVVEPVKNVEKKAEPEPVAKKEVKQANPPTFAEDMALWAADFNINQDALNALNDILLKHTT